MGVYIAVELMLRHHSSFMSLQRPGFAAHSSVISHLADFRQDPFKRGKKTVSVPEAHQDYSRHPDQHARLVTAEDGAILEGQSV